MTVKVPFKERLKAISIATLILSMASTTTAQDKLEVSVEADIVSKYLWRGFDQGSGASIQPSLGLAYKGIWLTAWGSTSITDLEPQEIDITLGYSIGDWELSITDYWWAGESASYGHYRESHYWEGVVSYCLGEKIPLTLSAATMFAGADRNEEGNLCYSTYFSAAYDIACGAGVTLTPSIGATTATYLHTGERIKGITDISVKAIKELSITKRFSIPLYVQFTASPVNDKVYMAVGLTLQ